MQVWRKTMSVGVEEIDAQHRTLIYTIGRLQAAMLLENGENEVPSVIEALQEYAKVHFRTEEKLMKDIGFPEISFHIRQHVDFSKKVESFSESHRTGKSDLAVEILRFLNDWLVRHILWSDKRYGMFLRGEPFPGE